MERNNMTREEAINKVRQMSLPKETMDILEALAPELRESEDERIRKALIHIVKGACDKYGIKYKEDEITEEKLLAYLEKQKYDRMKPIYDARESFESALEKAWNDYHNGYENVDKLEDDYVECAHAKGFREGYLFGFEKQKEQKPIVTHGETYHVDTLGTQQVIAGKMPQKSAEWSEEDADMLNCCISSIEEAKENRYAYKETDGDTSYDREIDWLKSLRPQPHTVSIKDATKFGNLEYERGVKDGIQSEKSRHWKPSEEQIYSLGTVVKGYNECTVGSVGYHLKEMYEQLKKLM